jgi:hypothetical protein
VVGEAPVARVVERPAGLWLELTGSPFDVPDEALERLEGFLAPILPTVEQVLEADGEVSRPVPAGAGAGRATRADGYADYGGPPVALEWLWNEEGLDLTFNVHFASRPVGEAERAFLRAVRSWYDAGVRGRYRPRGALRGEACCTAAPRWTGTATWPGGESMWGIRTAWLQCRNSPAALVDGPPSGGARLRSCGSAAKRPELGGDLRQPDRLTPITYPQTGATPPSPPPAARR